jgi:hypothetical protein
MKKMIANVSVGLALSGIVGVGLNAGLASTAGAATPSAVSSTTTAAHHPARAWLRAHRRTVARHVVEISAKTIGGITPQALASDLRSGQSIAEVAQAHNVAPQGVVNALVQAGDARIGQAVNGHKLTQAQGSKIEAALPGAVSKLVNHVYR